MSFSFVRLSPRYYRWHVDPGVDWVETNTEYAHLDWQIPLGQAALILVDVWEGHYLADCEARINEITEKHLSPLLTSVRKSEMQVIHAPSSDTAKRQSGWVRLAERNPLRDTDSEWPPQDFVQKEADYAAYARPFEPREPELGRLRTDRQIHALALPQDGEAVSSQTERNCTNTANRTESCFSFTSGSTQTAVCCSGTTAPSQCVIGATRLF